MRKISDKIKKKNQKKLRNLKRKSAIIYHVGLPLVVETCDIHPSLSHWSDKMTKTDKRFFL